MSRPLSILSTLQQLWKDNGKTIASLLIFSLVSLPFLWPLDDPISIPNFSPISGWYGPGAWISYTITITSALVQTFRAKAGEGWDPDILTALLYTAFASADLIWRCIHLTYISPPSTGYIPLEDMPVLLAVGIAVHVSFGAAVNGAWIAAGRMVENRPDTQDALLRRHTSRRHLSLWCIILSVAMSALFVLEGALLRLKVPLLSASTSPLDSQWPIFHQGPVFALRWPVYSVVVPVVTVLNERWWLVLPTLFGLTIYVILFPLVKDFCKGSLTWFILTATFAAILGIPTVWLACMSIWAFLALMGAVSAWWWVFIPRSGLFPQTGIRITGVGQLGGLCIALFVQIFRLVSSIGKNIEGEMGPPEQVPLVPVVNRL